jgi:hypothetical protein
LRLLLLVVLHLFMHLSLLLLLLPPPPSGWSPSLVSLVCLHVVWFALRLLAARPAGVQRGLDGEPKAVCAHLRIYGAL